jgi:hypothetical protein
MNIKYRVTRRLSFQSIKNPSSFFLFVDSANGRRNQRSVGSRTNRVVDERPHDDYKGTSSYKPAVRCTAERLRRDVEHEGGWISQLVPEPR